MDHNHETRIYWVPASYMETLKCIGHIPSEIIFKIPLLLHPGHVNSLSNLITRRPTSQLQCSFLRVHCRGHKDSIRCKSETPWIDNINCTRSKNLQGRCKCFSRDEVLRWNQKGGIQDHSQDMVQTIHIPLCDMVGPICWAQVMFCTRKWDGLTKRNGIAVSNYGIWLLYAYKYLNFADLIYLQIIYRV
jgi:hypothetical protein